MIRDDGFYIATKKYLVVDTPVFDEIMEGIQILQFFSHDNQQKGSVLLAEFGILEPHPMEINVKELSEEFQSNIQHFSEQEKDEIIYNMGDSGEFPKWFNILESEIFEKRRDSSDFPRIYKGKFAIENTNKFSMNFDKENGVEFDNADGEIADEKISLVYHYGNKDMLSIFKFVKFS